MNENASRSLDLGMSVAGVDGCRAGWIAFAVNIATRASSVELIDLPCVLQGRPSNLACVAIDIPIGLLDGSRACDSAARQLLGWPRRNSVFSPPCRESLTAATYSEACAVNSRVTNKKMSQQAWGIAPKIKQVDDAIRAECQDWVYEVHPEVCFWAMAGEHPMEHRKKSAAGCNERLVHLRPVFDQIDGHLANPPSGVGKDDLLDAAAAAWSALRIARGEGQRVSAEQEDAHGLRACIWY
jgi:predicted RNase H-like nuclease